MISFPDGLNGMPHIKLIDLGLAEVRDMLCVVCP